MGQIVFHCNSCGGKLSAELEEEGCEFECPHCQKTQMVPGAPSKGTVGRTAAGAPTTASSAAVTSPDVSVTRIPKRKIVISSQLMPDEDDDYKPEPMGGTGVAFFAAALGIASLLLCCLFMMWMLISKFWEHSEQWPVTLMVFLASFLMGLMGLAITRLSRLAIKLADRVSRLGREEK